MKTISFTPTHPPAHDGRPGSGFSRYFTAEGGRREHSRTEGVSFGAMLRRRKPVTGGGESGPPAGMVMPDMSIGAVPSPV